MKSLKLVTFVTIGLIACFAATGCKKKPTRLTPLPGQSTTGGGTGGNPDNAIPANPGSPTVGDGNTTLKNPDGTYNTSQHDISGRPQDREKWKNQTVYFDFDRSVVKTSETAKIDTVASEFKSCDPNTDLLIEGHCDERGTPEYNRALGERRALALREYLIKAGVNGERVHTLSFGKDKPAVIGNDDAAWSKNRRGEFILVLPK
jgi:peptidoglycan-associated lipoprotein